MSENDDSVWREIYERIKLLGAEGSHVKVGVLEGSGAAADGDISIAELAAIHEFGAPNAGIPERSFIRSTFTAKEAELVEITKKLARAVLLGKMTIEKALAVLGEWSAAAIKKTIVDEETTGPEPQALKPATIAAKGSSVALVDTSRLLSAVTYKVVMRGES